MNQFVSQIETENNHVYKLFSRVPKDMWFLIFRKVGMKNTKNLYISCKWLYNYITKNEYFNFLMEHKLMKLFHMFRNNMTFSCGKNNDGKYNQMSIYVYGKSIESHFAEYILSKVIENHLGPQSNAIKPSLPKLSSDFVFCEYCDRYHDTITEKMKQVVHKIALCSKCQIVTCKWNISKESASLNNPGGKVDAARIELYGKMNCKTYSSQFCDDCVNWSECECGSKVEDSTRLYCSTKLFHKMECDTWKCYNCFGDSFVECKCCGLYVCKDCLSGIEFSFKKLEKGLQVPVGSFVCKYCITNKIKQCMKCNEHTLTNLLWKCQYCTQYYHKQCFDIRTKCSLCKKGQKMPYEHVRKCGGNTCENCFQQIIIDKKKSCSKCHIFFEVVDCLLCTRGIPTHNKFDCEYLRTVHCSNCNK